MKTNIETLVLYFENLSGEKAWAYLKRNNAECTKYSAQSLFGKLN